MNEKKQPKEARDRAQDRKPGKALAGGKPGRIGETDAAPEHDLAMEKSGRREFGRDG